MCGSLNAVLWIPEGFSSTKWFAIETLSCFSKAKPATNTAHVNAQSQMAKCSFNRVISTKCLDRHPV